MKTTFTLFFRALLVLLLAATITLAIVVKDVIPETLGDYIKGFLITIFGESYELPTLLVLFFLILCSVLIGWKEQVYRFFTKGTDAPTKQDLAKSQFSEIRKGLTESYQNRLNQKLANRYPINLELTYSLEGTTEKIQLYDNSKITIPVIRIKGEIQQIFDRHRGRLLIIGVPGSGKTTLLLKLALSLLEREQNTIPIVVNVATWRERFESIEDWFTELLPQMGFSKGLTKQLLEKKAILPLFDGLDELAAEQRKPCLEAISRYGSTNGAKYIICSRIVEYSETIDAPVYCQLQVKPLTVDQIKTQLEQADTPEANGMLDAIRQDKLLAEVIKIPFYLNTVQLLFSTMKAIKDFGFIADTVEGRQKEIVEMFAVNSLNSLKGYEPKNAKRWLAFLANRMNKKGFIDFELLYLQFDWLTYKISFNLLMKFAMVTVFGTVFSSVLGLTLALTFSVVAVIFGDSLMQITDGQTGWYIDVMNYAISSFKGGLVFGLVVGILTAYIFSAFSVFFINGIYYDDMLIHTIDHSEYDFRYMVKNIIPSLVAILKYGLVIFVIYKVSELISGTSESLKLLFIVVFMVTFIQTIFEFFFTIFHTHIRNNIYFVQIRKPYQRFLASAKILYFPIILHLLLRYQLAKRQLLPFRLVTFLKQLTLNNMLESNGGTWRFRHRILQDYYADIWEREYKGKFEPKG